MYFTIAELAKAVKQTENFVRQHVNRNHLNVERDGRNVYVALDEAIRWAQERRLSLTLPSHVLYSVAQHQEQGGTHDGSFVAPCRQ